MALLLHAQAYPERGGGGEGHDRAGTCARKHLLITCQSSRRPP